MGCKSAKYRDTPIFSFRVFRGVIDIYYHEKYENTRKMDGIESITELQTEDEAIFLVWNNEFRGLESTSASDMGSIRLVMPILLSL